MEGHANTQPLCGLQRCVASSLQIPRSRSRRHETALTVRVGWPRARQIRGQDVKMRMSVRECSKMCRSFGYGLLCEKLRARWKRTAPEAFATHRRAASDDIGRHIGSRPFAVRLTEHSGSGFRRRVDRRPELWLRWYRLFSPYSSSAPPRRRQNDS
jgi:hypothetical protein